MLPPQHVCGQCSVRTGRCGVGSTWCFLIEASLITAALSNGATERATTQHLASNAAHDHSGDGKTASRQNRKAAGVLLISVDNSIPVTLKSWRIPF